MNTVLSTSLCKGLADWFNQNEYFVSIWDNESPLFYTIEDYYRIDVPQGGLTSIVIFPITSDTVKMPAKEIGKIGFNIQFSLNTTRSSRAELIYSTVSAVRAQLLSNPTYIQQFLSKTYVPGLQMINGQNLGDYAKLNRQVDSKAASTIMPIELNYMIDIYLNQKALWDQGNDFYSPVTKIYNEIDEINVSVNQAINTELLAYSVTPSQGYSLSGVAFLPSQYAGKAIILGNKGSVVQASLFSPLPENAQLQYLYVDTINELYLSTGILILNANAVSGNAGILLGDDGMVRNVVYDGSPFNTIFYGTNSVFTSSNYPVDGTLLTRIDVSNGNAGILFGNDTNIYYVRYSS